MAAAAAAVAAPSSGLAGGPVVAGVILAFVILREIRNARRNERRAKHKATEAQMQSAAQILQNVLGINGEALAIAQALSTTPKKNPPYYSDYSYNETPTVQEGIDSDFYKYSRSRSFNPPGKTNSNWAFHLAAELLDVTGGNLNKINQYKLEPRAYDVLMQKVASGEVEKLWNFQVLPVIPNIIKVTDNQVVIAPKKWIEKYKFDYCMDPKEGSGGWIYDKAKKDLGATTFGAKLLETFAVAESRWGQGNGGDIHHNPFSILDVNPPIGYPAIYSGHGYVRGYPTWDEGFNDFWRIIQEKYPEFIPLIHKDFATQDEINQALNTGPYYGEYPSYTNEDKGHTIMYTMKYVLAFNKERFQRQIRMLDAQISGASLVNETLTITLEAIKKTFQKQIDELESIYKKLPSKF